MLRRFVLLVLCGLMPAVEAQAQGEAPLAAELFLGADGELVRLIWVPTRWTPSISLVRLRRRLVGATEWQELEGMQFLGQREEVMLDNAQPADYARLREELLTDFNRAWQRGFGYGDDIPNPPAGDYEYGVFVRVGNTFLEQPVATAVWKPGPHIDRNVGIEALGVFRDSSGVQVQFRVDPRRLAAQAVGVRVLEERDGLPRHVHESLLIPATRDGWTAICHRPKEPLPVAVTVRAEDMFGFWSQSTVQIPPDVSFAKPPVASRACMPVRVQTKPVIKLPPPKLSTDVELIVGAKKFNARVLWIPKSWPEGMEGVQIMRRRSGGQWVAVGRVKRPSREYEFRLKRATPADFATIREELRGGWRTASAAGFGIMDSDSKELPSGVVEYGVFPVISDKRAAEPIATAPWLVDSEVDLDFGLATPRVVRDHTGPMAVFPLDTGKFNAKGGIIRVFVAGSNGIERQFTEASARAKPLTWKQICVPVGGGNIKTVRVDVEDMLGFDTSVSLPVESAEPPSSSAAATRDCFLPPPAPMLSTDGSDRPPLPPPPPPRSTTRPPTSTPLPAPASPAPARREPADARTLLGAASMWFDASEGVSLDAQRVAMWRDKTDNRFVATMTDPPRRPSLVNLENGVAALRFDGAQSLHLERPLELRVGTIIIVGRSGGDQTRNIILGPVGNNKNNQLRWEDAENMMLVGPSHGSSIVKLPVDGGTGSMHVMAVRYDGTSVGFWRNGRASRVYTFRKASDEDYSFNSIGSYYSQMYLTGEIAAIIVLPQALGPAEMEAVYALLRERYRIR